MSVPALLWLCLRTLAVALLLPMLVGFGATRLLPALRRAQPSLPQHFYLGFLGGGMLGLLLYGVGAPRMLVLGVLGVVALLGVPGLGQAMRECIRRSRENRLAQMVGVLLLPLLVAGIVFCCWDLVTGEDALVLWLARVRVLQAWLPAGELNALGVAQSSYPFLGPFWWWLVTEAARVPVEAGRIVFLVAYLLFFLDLVPTRAGERSWSVAVLVAALAYAFYREEWISGYQDGLVMLFFAWSAWILFRSAQAPQHALVFVPFIACIAGIKFEGGVLALILVGPWALFRVRVLLTIPLRAVGSALSLFIIPALWPLALRLGGATNTSVQGGTFSGVNAHWLVEQAWRVPVIARDIVSSTDAAFWIVALACLVGLALRRGRASMWIVLAIALHLLFLVVVFWSTHAPFEWHVMTALSRLRWQGALLWVALLMSLVEGADGSRASIARGER